MDPYALAEGAVLLGNKADAAAIEMAGAGGDFAIQGQPLWLALTGAPMRASLGGQALPWRSSFSAQPGQVLNIGAVTTEGDARGTYGYLHVAGGLDTPREIGSRSNHLRAGIGGVDGKPLSSGIALPVMSPARQSTGYRQLPAPEYLGRRDIRILWGPQSSRFSDTTRQRLLDESFRMSHRRDRMAMRLDMASGQPLESLLSGISDPAMVGDIQITGDGLPAILMREHQPTGGYPRIATVITADLAVAAQMPVGTQVRFRLVTTEEAISALRHWQDDIGSLADRISPVIRSAEQWGNLLDYNLIGGVVSADPFSGDAK
jgi:allophanate hydrolase